MRQITNTTARNAFSAGSKSRFSSGFQTCKRRAVRYAPYPTISVISKVKPVNIMYRQSIALVYVTVDDAFKCRSTLFLSPLPSPCTSLPVIPKCFATHPGLRAVPHCPFTDQICTCAPLSFEHLVQKPTLTIACFRPELVSHLF
jgi:hypothetical protein